jgi:hypothetical protein
LHCHETSELFNKPICWLLETRKQVCFEEIHLLKCFVFLFCDGLDSVLLTQFWLKKATCYTEKWHVCWFILVWFSKGSDAFNVLYAALILKLYVLSLVICLLKVYISFYKGIMNLCSRHYDQPLRATLSIYK